MSKFNERNSSLCMDLYELTMANGLFELGKKDEISVFDVFYRKNPDDGGYSIFCGLDQVMDIIKNFNFTEEDISYLASLGSFSKDFLKYLKDMTNPFYVGFDIKVSGVEEGTIVYPNTPLLTIEAPTIFAMLLETAILNQINHQSLIATKASRIVRVANGKPVADFGARRAHNIDASVYGARACYIGGCSSTATVLAGEQFKIPVSGTMAHSWVMNFDDELDAFKAFADIYPDNCILLVDTYDVLLSGIPNAIKTFEYVTNKLGRRPKNYGIRIDSGDLADLSKAARKVFKNTNWNEAKIVVSNSLDEYIISSLISQDAQIDSFGVGERMITSKSEPVFGAVYKMVGKYEKKENEEKCLEPKVKISNNPEKITNPGLKYLYRIYNTKTGYSVGDVISRFPVFDIHNECCVNPDSLWKKKIYEDPMYSHIALTQPIYLRQGGNIILDYNSPNIEDIRNKVKNQLEKEVWPGLLRLTNPAYYPVYFTEDYSDFKVDVIMRFSKDTKSDN